MNPCLGLKSDGGTILVAALLMAALPWPIARLGIWNLEFILLSTEVNLSLATGRFPTSGRSFYIGLQARYGIKYAPNEILDRSAIATITGVRHLATAGQNRVKIFDCKEAGSIR